MKRARIAFVSAAVWMAAVSCTTGSGQQDSGNATASDPVMLAVSSNSLLKYDSQGAVEWSRDLDTGVSGKALAVGRSGMVFVGGSLDPSSAPRALLNAYDAEGNSLWRQDLGAGSLEGLAPFALGTVYGGGFLGPLRSEEGFLRKFDADGNAVWTSTIESVSITAVAVSELEEIYAGGYTVPLTSSGFLRAYDAEGDVRWSKNLGLGWVTALSATQSGVLYVAGFVGRISGGVHFIRKYDTDGNMIWSRDLESSFELAVSGLGGIYVALDSAVRKYDVNGNLTWSQDLGSTAFVSYLAVSPENDAVFVGGFLGTFFETEGFFHQKFTLDGDRVYGRDESYGILVAVQESR